MKVRKHIAHGRVYWMADLGVIDGKSVRKVFQTKGAAQKLVADKREELRAHGKTGVALTDAQRSEFMDLRTRAAAAGFTLSRALEIAVASRSVSKVTVAEAAAACIASKRSGGRRERYVHGLEWFLSEFGKGRGATHIASVNVTDVEAFISERAKKPGSRATWINRVSTLFSFAKRSGWIIENPCDRLERPTIEAVPPAIFTPDQALKALTWTRTNAPRCLPWLALGLFAGLRPEEADRMTWEDLNLDSGTLQVDAAASKVRQRRVVELHQTAVAWLNDAKKAGGCLPIPTTTRRRLQRDLRGPLQLKAWPKDVLRHSAASYLLAEHRDAAKVALWLGNSPAILLRHYRELVSAEDSVRFWSIRP